jgi:PadR family transcriptional regulator AphA
MDSDSLRRVLSSLSYAILAMLASKPQSGYDLARQMRPPLGFLWQAKHGQIYPELVKLVEIGLVKVERVDKSSGPPRRVHSITQKGRAELARWVVKAPQLRPMNDELVVKAYALRRVPRREASELLQEQIRVHEHRLAALEHLAAALGNTTAGSIDVDSLRFGEYAALRRAIGADREYVAWCRWLLAQLNLAEGPAKHGPSSGSRVAKRSEAVRRKPSEA